MPEHWPTSCCALALLLAIPLQAGAQQADSEAADRPVESPASSDGPRRLPSGLFAADRVERLEAVREVREQGMVKALGKLASMARNDPYADVREAACEALGELGGEEQLELLVYLSVHDANAEVRDAADRAARRIRGEPEPEPDEPIFPAGEEESAEGEAAGRGEEEQEGYPAPQVLSDEPQPVTRHFAFGLGTMGGYGIAALNVRGRIATGNSGLPWVGLEIGGGWTPPGGYQLIAGTVNENITDDEIRWQLISGGAAVLLYLHRWHYLPIRGGFDIGQGPYAMLGYGFEHLNLEGFFSWGVEVGLLYHPVAGQYVERVTDCEQNNSCGDAAPWPVIPFIRFSLQFYLV
ncbi:MAG: HEAT repeat domain-containing protein [Polyangia bacterium]